LTGEKSLQDIVLQGPEGVHIVPGASGFTDCLDLDVGQQQRLLSSIRALEPHYDYMLVDTAAGVSPTVLHFIAACQVAVVVITPEPTSLTDAFSLLKVLKRRGYRRRVQILLNMVDSSAQADKVYQRFSAAVGKYLDLPVACLGAIWRDESMRTAVTLQRPVALYPADDPSARCFFRLAERVEHLFVGTGIPRLAFSAYWQRLIERRGPGGRPAPKQAPARTSAHVPPGRSEGLLDIRSEAGWHSLRAGFADFLKSPDTTPEQVLSLLTQGLAAWSDRLGSALGDLLFAALDGVEPEQLDPRQRAMLTVQLQRLGLVPESAGPTAMVAPEPPGAGIAAEDDEHVLVAERYDHGFGSQEQLADRIRSAGHGTSLESLLESIKFAALVEASDR
jgi:MinD-like ATPase involved in chromosome partitioning or flagellar assembly